MSRATTIKPATAIFKREEPCFGVDAATLLAGLLTGVNAGVPCTAPVAGPEIVPDARVGLTGVNVVAFGAA